MKLNRMQFEEAKSLMYKKGVEDGKKWQANADLDTKRSKELEAISKLVDSWGRGASAIASALESFYRERT